MRLPHHDLQADRAGAKTAPSAAPSPRDHAVAMLAVTARDWWPVGEPPPQASRRVRLRPSHLSAQFLPSGPLAPYGVQRLLLGAPGEAFA